MSAIIATSSATDRVEPYNTTVEFAVVNNQLIWGQETVGGNPMANAEYKPYAAEIFVLQPS